LRRFEEFKNFANKIWNGARFVFLHLEDLRAEELSQGLDLDQLALEDRWILSVLQRTIAEMNKCLTEYTFDRAAARSYEFFWNDFCALYVELAKPVLFGKAGTPEARKTKQKLLVILLSNAIRLMHPIAPFITEEIFSHLKAQFTGLQENKKGDIYTQETVQALLSPACIQAPYPTVLREQDSEAEKTFEQVNELVRAIRNIRAEMQIPPQEKTDLHITGRYELAEENQGILFALTPTARIEFSSHEKDLFGASALVGPMKLTIPLPESLRVRERARLQKELEKAEKLLESTQGKLKNEEFRTKAPREVVAKLETAERQTEAQISEIQKKLEQL
ncbi:MAG TPA: class I tRNA ligase family protein, partial [Chlamydiales bacterium]|nr:class I tRNA ligase family protein [Chlamydiales bacterium]